MTKLFAALSLVALTLPASAFAKSVRVAPFSLFGRAQSPSAKLAASTVDFKDRSFTVLPRVGDGAPASFGTNLMVASKGKTKVLFGDAVAIQVAFDAQSLTARGASADMAKQVSLDVGGKLGSSLEQAHPGRVWMLALDRKGAPVGQPVFLGKNAASSSTKVAKLIRSTVRDLRSGK